MIQLRYVIKFGKFGAYFYDNKLGLDLTLEQVKNLLNTGNTLDKDTLFIRYGKTVKPIHRFDLMEELQAFMSQIIQAINKMNFAKHIKYKAEWKLEITKI